MSHLLAKTELAVEESDLEFATLPEDAILQELDQADICP